MDDIPADDFPNEVEQEVAEILDALAVLVEVPAVNAQAQAIPVLNAPQAIPVLNAPQAIPVLNAPQAVPQGVPVLNAPQAIPVLNAPQAVPVLNAPQAIPVLNAPQAVPVGVPVLNAQAIPLAVPAAFRCGCRHMNNRCSLMGCSLRASSDLYCCRDHRQIAEANSKGSYAFHYFDGFSPVAEQDESCFVAIINAKNGINVGIPTFDINVHLTPPWNQNNKFFTDLKADWLFFTTDFQRMPAMHAHDNFAMAWRPLTKRHVLVSGVPVQNKVTVLPYNLKIISKPVKEEQSLLVQGWKLYQYRVDDSNNPSLFCLTRERNDIRDPIVKATTSKAKKVEGPDPDPDAGGKGEGGEKKGSGNKRPRRNAAAGICSVPVLQHTYKGVVDSHDLPLNVSREILQESRIDAKRGETESRWYSSLTNGKCRKSESFAHLNMKANWFMGESSAAASDSSSQAPPPAEKYEYQAEVSHLIVNSLYINKEVFLRELISNASDALDKLRYFSVTNPELSKDAADLDIRIYADKENGVITLTESGIGMTRQELVDCLGTIAQSGTAKFLQALKDNKDAGGDNNLIGQFGVGFYSAFLVADRVTVSTKSPKSDKQYVWEGEEGSSSYTIKEETDPQLIIPRGTRITLHLKPDYKGFADPERVQKLVKNYSQDYEKFWDNFGKHLKLGCIEDRENHKRIAPLLRFFSSQSENDMISLDEYVENMKAEQKAIYYVASDSITSAKNAPFLEKLLEKELEVLYLVEPIDEVAIQSLKSYKDKDFTDISKEDLDLGDKNEEAAAKKEFGQTCDWIKNRLGDKVPGVQISSRLSSSPCVKFGWSANMERLMKAQSAGDTTSLEFMKGRRVFAINPDHSIIKNINAAYKSNPNDEEAMKAIDLMYDAALVSSGFTPENPAELGGKIYEIQPQHHMAQSHNTQHTSHFQHLPLCYPC